MKGHTREIASSYRILPGFNHNRRWEARANISGCCKGIYRCIVRNLRARVNSAIHPPRTRTVDFDVRPADGETPTASLTVSFFTLSILHKIPVEKLTLDEIFSIVDLFRSPVTKFHNEFEAVDLMLNFRSGQGRLSKANSRFEKDSSDMSMAFQTISISLPFRMHKFREFKYLHSLAWIT